MRNIAPSCERNQDVIFTEIKPLLKNIDTVLEIGSASGQHAQYFMQQFSKEQTNHIIWQCTDRKQWIEDLALNIKEMNCEKILAPFEFDVDLHWPKKQYDLIYTANSIHIMSLSDVVNLFQNLSSIINEDGFFCSYGPFKYKGKFTSESNAQFDLLLKERDVKSGIKDIETLETLAHKYGMSLLRDIKMPANNQLLVWKKL
jgi:cyclopropane fatty-acyl-phospholipid synthase-like methyltransferase